MHFPYQITSLQDLTLGFLLFKNIDVNLKISTCQRLKDDRYRANLRASKRFQSKFALISVPVYFFYVFVQMSMFLLILPGTLKLDMLHKGCISTSARPRQHTAKHISCREQQHTKPDKAISTAGSPFKLHHHFYAFPF